MPNARVVKIASKCLQKLSHLPQTPQTWRIVEKTIMWIRHFLNDFYMSHNSANSVKASKDKIVSWYIGSISCKLALKKAKKKNELKFFLIYRAIDTKKVQRHLEDRSTEAITEHDDRPSLSWRRVSVSTVSTARRQTSSAVRTSPATDATLRAHIWTADASNTDSLLFTYNHHTTRLRKFNMNQHHRHRQRQGSLISPQATTVMSQWRCASDRACVQTRTQHEPALTDLGLQP